MVIKWVKERRLWKKWGPVGPMAVPNLPINLHLPEPKLSDPGQMSDARFRNSAHEAGPGMRRYKLAVGQGPNGWALPGSPAQPPLPTPPLRVPFRKTGSSSPPLPGPVNIQ